ncbi:MAG TPA: hypothetical protein VKF38_15815 [Anaerolineaceae bacterium]|nr:hypothetical protein [Anaerolineaceae bacterium]
MLEIFILTSGYLLLVIGLGLLFPWGLFRSVPSYNHLISSFWVGFALAIAFLQVWQIFWPVGMASFLILAAAGLCGWLLSWNKVREWLAGQNRTMAVAFLACAAFLLIFLSNLVIFSNLTADFGLYHLQTIKWFTSYRLPPGLVNLHYRLAFNQAGLLLAAQLDSGIFPGLAYYITSPLIFGALLLQTGEGVIFSLRKPDEIRNTHLASAFLFFVTIKYIGETPLAGYAPDRMIYVLEVALALAVMDLFEKSNQEDASFTSGVVYAILLIGLGMVVKLSFAGFGLASLLAISAGLVCSGKASTNIRPVTGAVALAGLLVIPWMVRGTIMSGYPLFPSNIISLPVIWRMPESDAAGMVSVVTNWARTCSNTIPLQSGKLWLLTWKNCMPSEFWEILDLSALTLGAAIVVSIWRNRMKVHKPEITNVEVLLAISLIALLFWLWVLPDYRFAGAAFWLLLLSCLLLLMNQISPFFTRDTNLKILAAAGLIFVAWLSPYTHNFNLQKRTFFFPPPAMEVAKNQYPQGTIIAHPMLGGGTVYSPSEAGYACWDAPLPCTELNDVRPRLMMFDSNHLQSGFYVAPKNGP